MLTLARIVADDRRDQDLLAGLQKHLSLLRAGMPGPAARRKSTGFDDVWQYGYGQFDAAGKPTLEFSPLRVWSGAAWQMTPDRPDGEHGFLRIDQTGGHPAHNRACIRRWTAPADGLLAVSGTLLHPAELGDGVRARIISSRSGVCGEWTAQNGSAETVAEGIEVTTGETIDFVVDKLRNISHDSFLWAVQADLDSEDGRFQYDSAAAFCGPTEKDVITNAVLAAACLESAWLRSIGQSIFEQLIKNTYDADTWMNRPHDSDSPLLRPALRRAWATAVQQRTGDTDRDLLDDLALEFWIPIGGFNSIRHSQGHVRRSWLAHHDEIVHFAGSGSNALLFRYPLTSEFEFSCDTQFGGRPATDGGLAYGGLLYRVDGSDQLFTVSDLDSRYKITRLCPHVRIGARPGGQYAGAPAFNSAALSSTIDRVSFALNGQTIWSDTSTGQNSPWLALQAEGDRSPIFRNLKITGNPVIPRQVRMSNDGLLRGWRSGYYGERMPSPVHEELSDTLIEVVRAKNPNHRLPDLNVPDSSAADHSDNLRPGGRAMDPDGSIIEHDWFARDGTIHGARRENGTASVAQSRLSYFRPIQDGESVSYEFLYVPEKYEAHPALGRLAFLIERDGIRLHWMTDGDREWTGLAEDNTVVEPLNRRGPKELPLVSGDWHRLTMALADECVTLSLNEQLIYERELHAGDERQFSFYHDACHSTVQVRNVILRGDWPEQLTQQQLSKPAALSDGNRTSKRQQVLNQLFQDRYLTHDVLEIVRHAAELSGEEKYEYLADWVLPAGDKSAIRMLGVFAPLPAPPFGDALPLGTPSPIETLDDAGKRVPAGTQLIAPAIDLITVAKQLDCLEKLRSRLLEADGNDDLDDRNSPQSQSLLFLVNIADGDYTAAGQNLERLMEVGGDGNEAEHFDRWPETIAVWMALRHEATQEYARELAGMMSERVRVGKTGDTEAWQHQIRALGSACRVQDQLDVADHDAVQQPLTQWCAVSHVTARSRGQGFPRGRWQPSLPRVENVTAHDRDYLYFQSPLRGDFQIECDLASAFGWSESHPVFAGSWTVPWGSLAHYGTGGFRDRSLGGKAIPVGLQLSSPGRWMRYRIVMRNGQMKVYLSGRLVREQDLPDDHDPWLAIRNHWERNGAVRDLRIFGKPVIPDALNLATSADLTGWLSYFEASVGDSDTGWQFSDNELLGLDSLIRRAPRARGCCSTIDRCWKTAQSNTSSGTSRNSFTSIRRWIAWR